MASLATTNERLEPKTIRITESLAVGPKERCFIIAEIGQNHQGDIGLAKKMISLAKECGADCVKFQKSNLEFKYNKLALLRPYDGPNSWGKTYGDHKKYLEFDDEDFKELQRYSRQEGILFSSSAMDVSSLMFLQSLSLPFIKIGSGDAHNSLMLEKAASLNTPLIVSTGMSNMKEVISLYNLLKLNKAEFCLLHCVSSYPLPVEDINLNVTKSYQKAFPDINIGYSGHELGIDVPLAAVALGAKIIEKHFTLNKEFKGSDHVCSLTPPEFKAMTEKIRLFEAGKIKPDDIFSNEIVKKALGSSEKKFQNSEKTCYEKLGKTLVAKVKLKKGDVLTWQNIDLKVAEPKGIPGNHLNDVIGKTVTRPIDIDESITVNDVNTR